MNLNERFLYWAPRGLAVIQALFLSLFAFDVFGTGAGFWPTLLGFLIHLLPTWLILLSLWVAWRREYVGGWLFMALGVFFILRFGTGQTLLSIALITWPLFLCAVLFLLHDRKVRSK